jgi:hypothetical protein
MQQCENFNQIREAKPFAFPDSNQNSSPKPALLYEQIL